MYGCGKDCLCDSHSIQTVTDQLLHSEAPSNASPLSQTFALVWGSDPCFSSPTPRYTSSPTHSLFFHHPSFVLPTLFYIFFSGGQVFLTARRCCVRRCIPDILMERDVLTSTYSSIILDLLDDTTLMAESEKELKSLLMRMKEKSGKADLKLNIQKTDHGIWPHHLMTNRWGESGNSVRFHFLGLQNHCRWWVQPQN